MTDREQIDRNERRYIGLRSGLWLQPEPYRITFLQWGRCAAWYGDAPLGEFANEFAAQRAIEAHRAQGMEEER